MPRSMMTNNQTSNIVRITLLISFTLLGFSFFLGSNANAITHTFNFYLLTEWVDTPLLSILTGIVFLVSALLVIFAAREPALRSVLLTIVAILALVPLFTLFSETRWIASLGGFPIIGSGQGIIKYAALLPLAVYLCKYDAMSLRQHALLNFLPVALVLYWIGAMKFFEFEANGIVSLVETSPFMSWLYAIFTVQGASNAIGAYDVLFATVLGFAIWMKAPRVAFIAVVGAGAVFVMTQTFLLTAEGAFSSATLLSGLGQFVIKDLWFIGNLAVITQYSISLDKSIFVPQQVEA